MCQLGPPGVRREHRTGLGGVDRQRDRLVPVLGLNGHLCDLGDPGGWYDHVPPKMLDYDGLGFRVPLLVISAYAKQAHVSHVHYELASILRFVEDRFGLPSLSSSDARAKSPAGDCFDFNQPPRAFQVIQAKRRQDYFMRQPLDLRPPDNK